MLAPLFPPRFARSRVLSDALSWLLWFPILLSACSSAPKTEPPPIPDHEIARRSLRQYLSEPFHETRTIEVVVATNRNPLPENSFSCGENAFGTLSAASVAYGVCKVNIPRNRSVGAIAATNNPRADTNKFLRVLGASPLGSEEQWISELKKRSGRGLLVFVHGFNIKFDEAVLRAAQIAYDLKFQGGVLLLSWPAGPANGFLESTRLSKTYETNQAAARDSIDSFAKLFSHVFSLAVPVYVTVHSMGHQVVLPALSRIPPPSSGGKLLEELFLNAPDFPVQEFETILPALRSSAKRLTVYCSYQDNAIAASAIVNKNRRLGSCERFEGVDVINVGELDAPALGIGGLGHGYYASRAILTDIFQAILGIEADRRLFIRSAEPNTPENFYLRP